jgi:hypothetical protein
MAAHPFSFQVHHAASTLTGSHGCCRLFVAPRTRDVVIRGWVRARPRRGIAFFRFRVELRLSFVVPDVMMERITTPGPNTGSHVGQLPSVARLQTENKSPRIARFYATTMAITPNTSPRPPITLLVRFTRSSFALAKRFELAPLARSGQCWVIASFCPSIFQS